jgi:hypothetical protein
MPSSHPAAASEDQHQPASASAIDPERIIRAHPRQLLVTPCQYPPVLPTGSTTLVPATSSTRTPCPGIPAKPTPPLPWSLNGPLRLTSRTVVFVPASRPPRSRHQQVLLLVQGRGTNCSAEGRIPHNFGSLPTWTALRRVETADCRLALNTIRCVSCAESAPHCKQLSSAQHSTALVSAGRHVILRN